MQRYIHLARIDRLRRLARILTFGGLGLMVLALLISLGQAQALGTVIGLSMIGLLASQLGTILMRRWPDRGRSDQILDAALKGLDSRHALIHYLAGARHALLTPRATLALFPIGDPGSYDFRAGELWRTPFKRDGSPGRPSAMRGVVEQARREARALHDRLQSTVGGEDAVQVAPVLVFFHPGARLNLESGELAAVHVKKLKDFVRQARSPGSLNPTAVARVVERFEPWRHA